MRGAHQMCSAHRASADEAGASGKCVPRRSLENEWPRISPGSWLLAPDSWLLAPSPRFEHQRLVGQRVADPDREVPGEQMVDHVTHHFRTPAAGQRRHFAVLEAAEVQAV